MSAIASMHTSYGNADQFWAQLQPRLSQFGITRVANVTGLDELGLPVCVAVRPLSRALSVSQGKGLSLSTAKVAAAMESIETWHAERINAPLFHGSAEQASADGLRVLDPSAFAHKPDVCDLQSVSTAYIEVQRWGRTEGAWLPFDCARTDFCFDDDHAPLWMRSTTGLAAGPTREAALKHALCELIERDIVQRWWAASGVEANFSRLEASCVSDPQLQQLLRRCAQNGQAVLVWDLSDSLPCFAVMLVGQANGNGGRGVGTFSGYGCNPSPAAALSAAVLEAVQSRLTLISGARDDMLVEDFERCRDTDWIEALLQRYEAAPVLQLPNEAAALSFDQLASDMQCKLGRPLYWLDLTRPDVGIPVVRVFMPGLRNLGMEKRYYGLNESGSWGQQ